MSAPTPVPEPGPGIPTPPIPLTGSPDAVTTHLDWSTVPLTDAFVERLRAVCPEVSTDAATLVEASQDWWPLAMTWAGDNQLAGLAGVVVRPNDQGEVAEILRVCADARVPVTAAGGRSGVCGGSVPLYGGVVLDLCGLSGIRSVDDDSLVVDVCAGTFGDHFEADLRSEHRLTCGHWPQSMALSTVGGWLACRGAGQYSTRYGKIEDMVVGLDVVLADGRTIATGGQARQAVGPDLNQLFVGSEGTLGVITGARLRVRPVPPAEVRAAFGFDGFVAGLDACRRILRRGATPAVLRLYDAVESERNFQIADTAVLLVLDEGEPELIDATVALVRAECANGEPLDESLVTRWLGHRNDVSQLRPLIEAGIVVDTFEITGPWGRLAAIYRSAIDAVTAVDGTLAVSAHLSHSYLDGACLYFTFGGKVEPDQRDTFYRSVWDVGSRAVLAAGGSLSHHHGVGLNRARFMQEALGSGFDTLVAIKQALDPVGILNPGKLGLPHPFGSDAFASVGPR